MADALAFLDSIRIDSAKGQAFINRLRGFTLFRAGRVADGEHALLEALELARSVVVDEQDMDQAYVAGSLDILARIYSYTGRLSEAEEAFKESLRISRNLLKSHPNPQWPGLPVLLMVSLSLLHYGDLLMRLGRFEEAKYSLREAERSTLEYSESSDSEFKHICDDRIHVIQESLGVALLFTGEANKAEDVYRKIIETSKNPSNQLDALVLLGTILSWTGRLGEAEEVLQQAVESLQRVVVEDTIYSIHQVNPLIHLGYILRVSHRSVKAEDHYRKALGICRKIADEQPEVNLDRLALTLREFAVFLGESGRYSEAEEISLEALEQRMGRLSEAETTLDEALEIARQLGQQFGPGRSELVFFIDLESAILNNMGLILLSKNRIKEAQKALEDAYALQSVTVDRAPLMFQYHLSIVLNNIGVATYHSGESSKGEEHLIKSLQIRRELEAKTPSRYLLDIASSLNNLALIQEECSRIKESEISRSEALDLLDQLASKEPQSNKRCEEINANIESKRMSVEFREICNLSMI
jgi:tetratricopeptide (TPR) repeat protein